MTELKLQHNRIGDFSNALRLSWSLNSSSLWRQENPAAGHCGVTALVANDLFGGEICKTRFGQIWHFYNKINGERFDFTESQFVTPLNYEDRVSNRDEAFGDTNTDQYEHLSKAVENALSGRYKS